MEIRDTLEVAPTLGIFRAQRLLDRLLVDLYGPTGLAEEFLLFLLRLTCLTLPCPLLLRPKVLNDQILNWRLLYLSEAPSHLYVW